MDAEILLPNSTYVIERMTIDKVRQLLVLEVSVKNGVTQCPYCQQRATRIHSRYFRRLKDLACGERTVELQLKVRRFFCDNEDCGHQTFAERLTNLAYPYARRTSRLIALMQQLGLLLGGMGSIHVLKCLPVETSRWTVLRDVRRMKLPLHPTPRILGIDDWALRKGHRYGTILVDMETHHIIDLLPDREAHTVADWLRRHPGVSIISRDRAGAYAQGARDGAPQAQQVADRWHLLKNLGEAITTLFSRHRRGLKHLSDNKAVPFSVLPPTLAYQERLARAHLARELRDNGLTITAIVHQLQRDRKTIRKYLTALPVPAVRPPRPRRSKLVPYEDYLRQHALTGQRTVRQLWRDVQTQGFAGSLSTVATFVAKTRYPASSLPPSLPASMPPAPSSLTPRQAAWLILAREESLTLEQREQAGQLASIHAEVANMAAEARSFATMLRLRQVDVLDAWLERATHSPCRELTSFARGIRRDYAAVKNALTLHWNNGLVEGQVNRLKFFKRQMFGRANFDLLRLRILSTAAP